MEFQTIQVEFEVKIIHQIQCPLRIIIIHLDFEILKHNTVPEKIIIE